MSEELPLGDNRLDSLPNEAFAVTNEIEAGDLAFKDFNDPSTLRRYCFEILVRFMRLDYGYKVSFKTFSERLAVCSTCEHFNEEKVKCMHCECNLAEKAHECLEHCPLDLWKEDPESFEKKYYKELEKYANDPGNSSIPSYYREIANDLNLTAWEVANMQYRSQTGKDLPKPGHQTHIESLSPIVRYWMTTHPNGKKALRAKVKEKNMDYNTVGITEGVVTEETAPVLDSNFWGN